MALSYFYDSQIRRYIEQVQRVFSNFQIFVGKDKYGSDRFHRIPCIYGDSSRMAQHIIRDNTENKLVPTPFFAIYDNEVIPAPERRQHQSHIDKRKIIERKYNKETQLYEANQGNRYTVERYMPIPYTMHVTLDLWYTQTDHKLQLCEQIMTLFNDNIDLQTGTNSLDWSALTWIRLINMIWDARGVPSGIDDGLRITSFVFEIPIWINPPAKLKQQKIIEEIVTDIYSTTIQGVSNINNSWEGILNISPDNFDAIFNESGDPQRTIITPGQHQIQVIGNEVSLLGPDQSSINPDTGNNWEWTTLLDEYGKLRNGFSLLRLRSTDDIEVVDFDYIGRLSEHPTDTNKLIWSIDLETIPLDSVDSISAIVDPSKNGPGTDLPGPANGQRYLLTEDIASPTDAWGTIVASKEDIIEFNGAIWSVSFDASITTASKFTTNEFSGKKLKFDETIQEWIVIPDGIWAPGYWRLVL